MRRKAQAVEPIDDDALYDVTPDWFEPDALPVDHEQELEDGEWLRSLANDVNLLSRREWPKADAGWGHRERVPRIARRRSPHLDLV